MEMPARMPPIQVAELHSEREQIYHLYVRYPIFGEELEVFLNPLILMELADWEFIVLGKAPDWLMSLDLRGWQTTFPERRMHRCQAPLGANQHQSQLNSHSDPSLFQMQARLFIYGFSAA